ncbi:Tad domain-containing protein [Pseudomonas sp. CLCA07]
MMNLRIQQPFTSTPRRQEGSVSVLMVIALASMAMMAALALDGGHMMLNKTRLQNVVDAAALSGAKTLSQVEGGVNSVSAADATRTAALNTLIRNANATGNNELATAVGGNAGTFAVVELASSVYGPFAFPGPTDAKYVRVSVQSYKLTGFFWNFAQAFGPGGLGTKAVAAIATAGPSPTSPCDLAPLMVCGDKTKNDPAAGMFWGFQFGNLQVLKTGSGKSSDPIGPGNFQLLDFGTGGNAVKEEMAGGGKVCRNVGDNVLTEPGNKVGPASQGLNTRFGIYQGGQISASAYPPDLVTTSSDPAITDDGTGPKYNGQAVTSNNGNLTAGGNPILDYNDWRTSVAACVAGASGCESNGVFERRMLKVVVGDCTGKQNGSTSIPVLGFGCYFVVQPMDGGGDEQIFGQFVQKCEGDNVAGPSPSTDAGPQIIQLYKTYLGIGTPSTDS